MTMVFSKDISTQQCNASTTKLMTALVAFDLISNMNDQVTVSAADLVGSNESRVNFQALDVVSYLDLLYGLMLPSGNDASNCLARNLGGASAFIGAMNTKAANIGMTNTNFADTSGVSYLTTSTALDLSKLMTEYAKNQLLVTIAGAMTHIIKVSGVNARDITIEHTVKPYISRFPELICSKTGTVSFGTGYEQYDSGGCIIALWKLPSNESRVSVVLGSGIGANDRYDDLRKMIDFEIARSKL
ncbi:MULTISPECIES: D-alanyl-D-alanine carboxypeptidase family protein [unclassified Acinetobacter]|uniref:D-alanyl-D-alanine carboxypeptidase family protein n=1 Tax=unclassified Acinetobacter TaxID=196816 RepID=UPI0015D28E91|nr:MULTISPECIES: serine hydrolase [unclassified Acinetobacter]